MVVEWMIRTLMLRHRVLGHRAEPHEPNVHATGYPPHTTGSLPGYLPESDLAGHRPRQHAGRGWPSGSPEQAKAHDTRPDPPLMPRSPARTRPRLGGPVVGTVDLHRPSVAPSGHGANCVPATGVRPRRLDRRATSFGLVLRWRLLRTACWVSGVQKIRRRSRARVTAV
jgi:hypothetical protein